MRLSDLLGLTVRTESGTRVGRVHDVRGRLGERSLAITGLVVGRLGVLERLGLGAPRAGGRLRSHDIVEWDAIVRVDRRGVVVRDDAAK